MSFSTSLSGLRGAQTELSATANNIANASTVGFKRSRVEFGDIMPPSRGAAGLGTRVKDIQQLFTQGGFQNTARGLDVALTGSGFFATREPGTNGQTYFTRAGSFNINAARTLVDSNGSEVQVLPVDDNGQATAADLSSASALRMPTASGLPRATSALGLTISLPGTADEPAERVQFSGATPYAFDPANSATYNFAQTTNIVDSGGVVRPATLYFTRTGSAAQGDAADAWQVRTFVSDVEVGSAPIDLTFDASGVLTSPSAPVGIGPVSSNGTAPPFSFTIDFGTASRQVGSSFRAAQISQNGFAPSDFSTIDIANDGLVTASFADGTTQKIGRLLVVEFANPGGLRQNGNARWTVTGDSGDARVVTPGRNGTGSVQSGILENANVDLTEELVGLITAQRNFQANAKAIETANAINQSILNIN